MFGLYLCILYETNTNTENKILLTCKSNYHTIMISTMLGGFWELGVIIVCSKQPRSISARLVIQWHRYYTIPKICNIKITEISVILAVENRLGDIFVNGFVE
jgi:hypothetical protein